MKKTKKFILLAVSLFFLYGCLAETVLFVAGAGGGVVGYKYIEGHASNKFHFNYSKAWDASNKALENLNISISNSESRDPRGIINGIQKDGKNVRIKLKATSEWVTTISVRVGKLSNRADADKILAEIASVAGL